VTSETAPRRQSSSASTQVKKKSPAAPSVSPWAGNAQALAEKLGIELHRPQWMEKALRHKSAQQELNLPSNERLEFLGDAVLGLTIAGYLFRSHPDLPEGELTKVKAVAVSEPVLAKVARELDLGAYLTLAKGEEQSGGRNRSSILADAMEAVIAAIYLDRGLILAKRVILELLGSHLAAIERSEHDLDYKTLLQERIQELHRKPPSYHVVAESGPDHDRTFTAEVRLAGQMLGRGMGKSKKQAEQAAARQALAAEPSAPAS
jgi:ribonuclease III